MSLVLSSTDELIRVNTKGMRASFDSHELVDIGKDDMPMDEFCKMVQEILGGSMSLRAGPFYIEELNPVLVWQNQYGDFSMSKEDFYMMVRYVLTNTDIYVPLDPRPGLFDWIEKECDPGHGLLYEDARNQFVKDCKAGGCVPGYNEGKLRLEIPNQP